MCLLFIATHFPTSPFLSFGFLVLSSLSFPLPSPCSHSFPRRFPFISPCFPVIPFAVPCMFLHVPLSPPLRFPALPCIPLHFMVFSQEKVCFLEKEVKPTHGFSRCEAEQPEPAKSRQGDSSLGPCFATPALRTLFLVERHEIAKRPAPAPHIGGGSGGRFILSSLWYLTCRVQSNVGGLDVDRFRCIGSCEELAPSLTLGQGVFGLRDDHTLDACASEKLHLQCSHGAQVNPLSLPTCDTPVCQR